MTILDEISKAVDERGGEFTALSDQIWDNPELRWNEFASVTAQIEVAERAGFTVQRQVAGIPTAFYAEHGTGGPVIAILGEFDSLAGLSQESGVAVRQPDPANESGNGQGCGHHLLGTGSLLAAVAVARFLDGNGLPGRVRYYGCPAEEAAAGKSFMVKGGAFADVDAAVSWHPASVTGVMRADVLAYCQAYFSFDGVAAHAGAAPWLGRSALDAAELMNVGVNFLREHMPPDTRIHYAFVDSGGPSPNVVHPPPACTTSCALPTSRRCAPCTSGWSRSPRGRRGADDGNVPRGRVRRRLRRAAAERRPRAGDARHRGPARSGPLR
ncbi:MAG TPA: amidohydrolase [Trebonia sp.]